MVSTQVAPLHAQLRELQRRRPRDFDTPLSFKYGQALQYVTRTLPVTFVDGGDPFLPSQGSLYPRPTLSCAPFCRACAPTKKRTRRRQSNRAARRDADPARPRAASEDELCVALEPATNPARGRPVT